jgi:hypothetical protein
MPLLLHVRFASCLTVSTIRLLIVLTRFLANY